MTIRYKCEECGSVLNIKDEKAGTKGRCPKCKAEFLVPSPEEVDDEEVDDEEVDDEEVDDEEEEEDDEEEEDEDEDDDEDEEEDEEESSDEEDAPARHVASTKPAKPIAKPRTGRGDMDSDEIEQILDAKAPASQRDDYGVSSLDDEDEEEGDEDSSDEEDDDDDDIPSSLQSRRKKKLENEDESDWEDDEDDERPPKKGTTGRSGKPEGATGVSAAGMAKGLMARGDKALKLDDRPGSRHFGGRDGEEDDDDGFSVKERILYFARWLGPAGIGVVIAIGSFMWYMSGWQRGSLPDLGSVSGTVTLDGAPLANALVQFHPVQADPRSQKITASSSMGVTDPNGKYVLTYTALAQGAVLGKHRVEIADQTGMKPVPERYNLQTTLESVVKPGSNTIDFPLNSAKENTGGAGGFNR